MVCPKTPESRSGAQLAHKLLPRLTATDKVWGNGMKVEKEIEKGWDDLSRAATRGRIGLFLGAGLSIPNKLPSWFDLTAQLCDKECPDRVGRLRQTGVSLESQLAIAQKKKAPSAGSLMFGVVCTQDSVIN